MSKLFMPPRNIGGVIPPYLLTEMARRNPTDLSHLRTLAVTQELWKNSLARGVPYYRLLGAAETARREVYNAENGSTRPGKRARFEGDAPTGDEVIDNAYEFTGWVRKYYWEIHKRNGINSQGMKFKTCAHFEDKYNNAYWDGEMMTYGDGDGVIFKTFVLLDVTGHEITHGITEFEANTRYYGQSGALNEHFSDAFGETIEQFKLGQNAIDADWLVGKGIFMPKIKGVALRSMLNPGEAYNDPKLGKDPQPAHMDEYVKTSSDNGGVHINSGIPNKAFATFARNLGGKSWDQASLIWYGARVPAGDNPSFAKFAQCTFDAANVLYPKTRAALEDAWKNVGVKASATAVDDMTPDGGEADEDAA